MQSVVSIVVQLRFYACNQWAIFIKLKDADVFWEDNNLSIGTFLKELTANKRKYMTFPFMAALLAIPFTVFAYQQ